MKQKPVFGRSNIKYNLKYNCWYEWHSGILLLLLYHYEVYLGLLDFSPCDTLVLVSCFFQFVLLSLLSQVKDSTVLTSRVQQNMIQRFTVSLQWPCLFEVGSPQIRNGGGGGGIVPDFMALLAPQVIHKAFLLSFFFPLLRHTETI